MCGKRALSWLAAQLNASDKTVSLWGRNLFLVYENERGETYEFHSDEIPQEIYQHLEDTEPVLQYRRLNLTVSEVKFSSTDEMLPVYVFDLEHYGLVRHRIKVWMAVIPCFMSLLCAKR